MNRRVLFSPLGGTDPISLSNCMDGSMLHICREYKPDLVYLYMSKEILDCHRKDNRYLYCLEKLDQEQNRHTEVKIIARENLVEVQEYDFFYREFTDQIRTISAGLDDSDELLVNVSSGTPAMKSALLVFITLGEYSCVPVQVVTPVKGMNEHLHEGYDVETLWELDGDNKPEHENRCREVHCPTLSDMRAKDMIKRHVRAYDYAAALDVVTTMDAAKTDGFKKYIEAAYYRSLLDFSSANRILKEIHADYFPIKSGNEMKCFEYAANMEIKIRKHEYADFIRAITPLLADLFEKILQKTGGVNINDYCEDNKSHIRKWSRSKLQGTEVLQVLDHYCFGKYGNSFGFGNISSEHLVPLINHYAQGSRDLVDTVNSLREIEKAVRNNAAHEIVSVTETTIKVRTGFTPGQIMDLIKKAFVYSGINVKKENWKTYDQMNDLIINQIEKEP